MTHPRISSIYNHGQPERPSAAEASERVTALRAHAWQVLGLAVLDPDEIDHEWLRAGVIAEATARYGKRGG